MLSPEAVTFLRERGGHLVVFTAQLTGCCGIGAVPAPMVDARRPLHKPEHYVAAEVDGVVVHQDRGCASRPERLLVSVTRFLGWSSLTSAYADLSQ